MHLYMFTFLLISLLAVLRADGDDAKMNGNLVENLSFKETSKECTVIVYLRQPVNARSINFMESKDGDAENFMINESIEKDVDWEADQNRFSYTRDKSSLKEDTFYAIQILDQNGAYSHSEPFVYQDGKYVLTRNYTKSSSKAVGIVALVLSSVALLLIIVIIFVKFCT